MKFYEMICFAKVYNVVYGYSSPSTVSRHDVNIAIEVLKKMADDRYDWSQEQKDCYKLIADFAKEYIKDKMK